MGASVELCPGGRAKRSGIIVNPGEQSLEALRGCGVLERSRRVSFTVLIGDRLDSRTAELRTRKPSHPVCTSERGKEDGGSTGTQKLSKRSGAGQGSNGLCTFRE